MAFSPELAEIRFGCGLSPVIAPVPGPLEMLRGLPSPDEMAARFPIEPFSKFRARLAGAERIRKQARETGQTTGVAEQIKAINRAAVDAGIRWSGQTMLRWAQTRQGFRERLVAFWADHFTARGKISLLRAATSPYIEDAIRPNIAGSFADLLIAATTHPLMLHFLDQSRSVGPASTAATRSARLKGLNENLAREVLELHTMGVDGPYSQQDVRQLAELFTGLSFTAEDGFRFRPNYAEPGPETVLGRSYGGDPATLEPVLEALRDLAVHPATARHIAGKLVTHFVSDRPDPALTDHVAARFAAAGGDLMAAYGALVEHPLAWDETLRNVKPPADFAGSALRALAMAPEHMAALDTRRLRRALLRPMAMMGQPWQRPGGPDGWPEQDSAWVTPQALSARLRWAVAAPPVLRPDLPDPRAFAGQALGPYLSGQIRFAAEAAESRAEAIGLVLASPAFQRR